MIDRVAAIVLAGGRSARFGRDKLREPIDGRPLIQHAIDAVAMVAEDVIVVVGLDEGPELPDGILVVHDRAPFQGPLAALVVGLEATDAPRVLVVGGDMPSLVPDVLRRLIDTLDDEGADASVLDDDGHRRPLPMALRRMVASPVASRLIEGDEHRLRALRDALRLVVIPDAIWRSDDPAGMTLRDIDTAKDL